MKPWLLRELSLEAFQNAAPYEVAVLPLGATEPHNLHLPYGTDTYQVEAIGEAACARAWAQGQRVVLLPALPYGTETNQNQFPWSMNLNPTTVAAVITDLVESLTPHGVRKIVLLNGHGGNDLKWVLRQLYGKTPAHLFLCNWWKTALDRYPEIFSDPGDHGGDLETSLMMAIEPDLVRLERADAGTMAPSRFEAVNRGWVDITRPWHLLTTNSGAGDPRAATAEKGHAAMEIVVERFSKFLVELARTPLDQTFPLVPHPEVSV